MPCLKLAVSIEEICNINLKFLIMIDYYRILGIEFGVDLEEIRKAYKKKALEFHPDKNNGEKNYEERFIEIQNAYNVLKDSSTKEEYDKQYQSSIEH